MRKEEAKDLVKDFDDFSKFKLILSFAEVFEGKYFVLKENLCPDIEIIEKEECLQTISELISEKEDNRYTFFYKIIYPKSCCLLEYTGEETEVIPSICRHYSYIFSNGITNDEIERFRRVLLRISSENFKSDKLIYFLVDDFEIDLYMKNKLTEEITFVKRCTFGRIYKIKHHKEVF
ncbi:hypothetical protein YS40_105 [Thermus phage phiYS40]|uniref:hypothetical protein n=1 Tax=Thermus phage phiYS40 TaxID=407392 RepID=UPI0000E689DF|nr:hypothetical protein YS40_105 [Thermus phage phiYS40]ABJ91499.1 hypothetical protein YS40_105 [Thermus phage phiYS40]BAK53623.1 hypothetical protein YSP_105 [Thermus phage phiYS40]